MVDTTKQISNTYPAIYEVSTCESIPLLKLLPVTSGYSTEY